MVAADSTKTISMKTITDSRKNGSGKKSNDNRSANGKNKESQQYNSEKKKPMLQKSTTTPTTTNKTDAIVSTNDYPLQNHLLVRMDIENENATDDTQIENEQKWYTIDCKNTERNATMTSSSSSSSSASMMSSSSLVTKYRTIADSLYRREVQLYHKKNDNTTTNSNTNEYNNNNDTNYNYQNEKDNRWVESTMKRGTLKDRIAAMSVVVSTDPIHKLYALDGLYQMMGCSLTLSNNNNSNNYSNSTSSTSTNDRVAQLAAEAVEDIFINTLLPSNRKLLTLAQRPLHLYEVSSLESSDSINTNKTYKQQRNNKNKFTDNKTAPIITKRTLSPKILLLWRFEEMIKEKYEIFVKQYIAKVMNESSGIISTIKNPTKNKKRTTSAASNAASTINIIERQKVMTIRTASTLLKYGPELENDLLQLIVNKLGDPCKRIASSASHELRKVLANHSAMTVIVAREVQQLVHRPNLSYKALYNCIAFLNQLKLSSTMYIINHDNSTSKTKNSNQSTNNDNNKNNLQQQELQNKRQSLPASLITTYFRLFEVAVRQSDNNNKSNNKRKINDTTTGTNKKSSSSSLSLSNDGMKGRLLSALLTGVNRAHPYLPDSDKDMDEHIDALYRVVHTASTSASTQALLLLFHLVIGTDYHPNTKNNTNINSTSSDQNNKVILTHQERVAKEVRIDRFYRALYSTISQHDMITTVGKHSTMYFNLLYKAMRHETNTTRLVAFSKKLSSYALHSPSSVIAATIFLLNEICKYHPVLLSCYDEILFDTDDAKRILDPLKREPRGALIVFDPTSTNDDNDNDNNNSNNYYIDNNEKKAPSWDLSLMKHHFHPSVHLFATKLGTDDGIDYSGDPLKDFSIGPFLDKFAYKNPKSIEKITAKVKRGESIAERKSDRDIVIQSQSTMVPVNDPEFLNQPCKDHNIQDNFFRQFFQERSRRNDISTTTTKGTIKQDTNDDNETKRKGRRKGRGDDSDNDDDDDDNYYNDNDLDAIYNEEDQQIDIDGTVDETDFNWGSDSEEEAFVDSLAQQMFEDACGGDGGQYGPTDLDAEDPDMDDWDDIGGDNGNSSGSNKNNKKYDNKIELQDDHIDDNDDDDDDDNDDDLDNGATTKFVIRHHKDDEEDSSSDNEKQSNEDSDESADIVRGSGSTKKKRSRNDDDDDAFMEESGSDDSGDEDLQLDEEDTDNDDQLLDDSSDDGSDFHVVEDGDTDSESSVTNNGLITSKADKFEDTFAAAEDYADLINASWNKSISKRQRK